LWKTPQPQRFTPTVSALQKELFGLEDKMSEDSTNSGNSESSGNSVPSSESQNPPSTSFFDKIQTTLQTIVSSIDRQVLKTKIKEGVDVTNHLLGNLEQKYDWMNSRIQPIVAQGKDVGQKTLVLYEQRRLYGPQWIGASVVATALIAGIKTRGRMFPTLLLSGFVGGMVSMGIYGVPPVFDTAYNQYRIFRKRED